MQRRDFQRLVGSIVLSASMVAGNLTMIAPAAQVMAANTDISDVLESDAYSDYVYPADKILPLEGEELDKVVSALIESMTDDEKDTFIKGNDENKNSPAKGEAGRLPGVPRFGIPEFEMHDGPAGIQYSDDTTNPPQHQLLASTWDKKSAYDYGAIAGSEELAIGGNGQLGTEYDLMRVPTFGRAKDQLGEDPYLASVLSAEETKGTEENHAVAVTKHFAAFAKNATPAYRTETWVSEQALHEIYLPAFESAIKAGAGGVMNSYGSINGHYASLNKYLNIDVLRDMWGFKGFVVSDWGGNQGTSFHLGTDLEMATGNNTRDKAIEKYGSEEEASERIDTAVSHVLNAMGKVGYLGLVKLDDEGKAVAYGNKNNIKIISLHEDKAKLQEAREKNNKNAQEIAEKGGVLLKNDGALPLEKNDDVAVIGVGGMLNKGGIGSERSPGTAYYMTSPYDAMKDAGYDVEGYIYDDIAGTTIPKEYLYTTTGTNADNGVVEYYGTGGAEAQAYATQGQTWSVGGVSVTVVSEGNDINNAVTGATGNTYDTLEFKVDKDAAKNGNWWKTGNAIPKTAAAKNGKTYYVHYKEAGGWGQEEKEVHEVGQAFTWETYLKAPEDGEYRINVNGIGGSISGKISEISENGIDLNSLGSMSPGSVREGGVWFGDPACTPEGMGISQAKVNLKKDEFYKIEVQGIANRDEKNMQVQLAWVTPSQDKKNREEAIEAAAKADKTVLFLYHNADDSVLGGMGTPETDTVENVRKKLDLADDQKALLEEVAEAANNLIVVLNNDTAVTIDWADKAAAILEMYYPGQAGGVATANLLTGKVNPSGKLAYTIQADSADTIITKDQDALDREDDVQDDPGDDPDVASGGGMGGGPGGMGGGPGGMGGGAKKVVNAHYDEGIFTGYRWYNANDIKPAFDFGHGLSYTTFEYSNMNVEAKWEGKEKAGYDVTFTVKNTGDVTGSDVAQVYLGAADVDVPVDGEVEKELGIDKIQMAPYQLAGFERVEDLKPGDSKTVTIHVNERSLSYWNTNAEVEEETDGTKGKWTIAEGEREVVLAKSSNEKDFVDKKTINVGKDVPKTPEKTPEELEAEAIAEAEAGKPAGTVSKNAADIGVTELDGLVVSYQSKIPFFGKKVSKDIEKVLGTVTFTYNNVSYKPAKANVVKHPGTASENNASIVIKKLEVKEGTPDKKELKKVQKAIKKATKASRKKPGNMKASLVALDLGKAVSENAIENLKLSGKPGKLKFEFTFKETGEKFKTAKKDTFGNKFEITYDAAKGVTVTGSNDMKGTAPADKIDVSKVK